MARTTSSRDLMELTAQIVAAHVGRNATPADSLPGVIAEIHRALAGLGGPGEPAQPERRPAVAVENSVTPDYIVCLEDGKRFKTLRRHLKAAYDLTPEQYRARWGLPPDYPMVAANYARKRSRLARAIGLGTRSRGSA